MARREETIMDHQERMNRVLVHIQKHLDEDLALDVLADVACFSPFHFHRIFAAYVGEKLNEYVTRLRLENAANKLCHMPVTVTEIALSAGYETPGAFNKAFKKRFKQSPTSFKKRQRTILMPEKKLVIRTKPEENIMQPETREMEDSQVIFVRQTGPYGKAAEKAWGKICGFAFRKGLVGDDARFIGISHDDPQITPEDKLRYDACITIDKEVVPKGEVGVQTITGGSYAVFLHRGPYENMSQTYGEAYGQWLPASGEKLRDAPCFELYLNSPDEVKPAELLTEIHIPLE